ncbi:hypothetical protein ACNF49_08735 [Actinomadura sp. ATCC 39365]
MHVIDISPDQRLLDLQRAAYAVEAALIGDDRVPPLHEPLSDLLAAPLTWVGAFEGDALLGAIADNHPRLPGRRTRRLTLSRDP